MVSINEIVKAKSLEEISAMMFFAFGTKFFTDNPKANTWDFSKMSMNIGTESLVSIQIVHVAGEPITRQKFFAILDLVEENNDIPTMEGKDGDNSEASGDGEGGSSN